METTFFVQCERNEFIRGSIHTLSVDAAEVVETINENNCLFPEHRVQCDFGTISILCNNIFSKEYLQSVIPVGGAGFVEMVMRDAYGFPGIKPQLIPEELQKEEFLQRRVAVIDSTEQVEDVMSRWNTDRLFIKSASRVACDFTNIYKRTDDLPVAQDKLFVSEEIKSIVSEWRIFYSLGQVRGVKHYDGNPWVVPNSKTVKCMTDAMDRADNPLQAYALDVAVVYTPTGNKTVVIGVHNFIACKLYGAKLPLFMYSLAYRQELECFKRSK